MTPETIEKIGEVVVKAYYSGQGGPLANRLAGQAALDECVKIALARPSDREIQDSYETGLNTWEDWDYARVRNLFKKRLERFTKAE